MEQTAVQDDAAANAGTQGDKDHVIAALAAALPVFPQGRHVGIVSGLDGEARHFGQGIGDVKDPPAQVDALIHHAAAVHRPGNADADAQNGGGVYIVLLPIALDRGGNVRQNVGTLVIGDRGNLPLIQHGPVFVKVGDLDGGAAQINAKTVFHGAYLLKEW